MRGGYGKKFDERITIYYLHEGGRRLGGVRNRANKINEAAGISRPRPGVVFVNVDHGQESPHAFLDVSHLTSAT